MSKLMRSSSRWWVLLLFTSCGLLMSGCDRAEPVNSKAFQGTANMHEFMLWYLEPAADVLWDSAGYVITEEGERDLQPTTQEGWDHVRNAATVVAEGGNLLMLPDYAADSGAWLEYSAGLTAAGVAARDAAMAKDADALFQAGANLYSVCLACHNRYIIQSEGEM